MASDASPPVLPFGPGSLQWDFAGDRRFSLMFSSAFLLQTMHPEIGAAVSKQSVFQTDPAGRAERSLLSVQRWVYGGQAAFAETTRLIRMHEKIRGVDDTGRRYDARDPDAWAWVPLSAFNSSVRGHPYFYGAALTREEEARSYEELRQLCRLLKVEERLIPPTVADYWTYFDDIVENTLVAHPMAHAFLDLWSKVPPPKGWPRSLRALWPTVTNAADSLFRLSTVGVLPERAREKMGLGWTSADETKLRAVGRVLADVFPRLPERLRYMPIAYRAREAARAAARFDAVLRGR